MRSLPKSSLKVNQSYQAISLEKEIRKAVMQGEPIEEGVKAAFSADPDNVVASNDIRADKFDLAQESLTAVDKAKTAKKKGVIKGKPGEGGGGTEGAKPPSE